MSENAVLKWYKESRRTKGKSIVLDQMKKFAELLENAEEDGGNLVESFKYRPQSQPLDVQDCCPCRTYACSAIESLGEY